MKTIVELSTNISKYILEDDVALDITDTHITVGSPVEFIIGDMGSSNSVVYENVTPPEDWFGCKFTFDGSTWDLNADFSLPPGRTI